MHFDVHAHAIPTPVGDAGRTMAAALIEQEGFAGSVPGSGWTVDAALDFMDERDIRMQLLSTPGVLDARGARDWNHWAASIVSTRPERFGLLAALPMAQPDQAVEEIRFALDQLHADGFVGASNYEGEYFGSPRFEPIFLELDRRGAALFVHPAIVPGFDRLGLSRPGPLFEYPVDTARTMVDAVFAGVLMRFPRVSFVLAHGGGVLPTLRDRLGLLGPQAWVHNPLGLTKAQIIEQLASVYVDTAIAGGLASIEPALQMVGADHIVFGTDYPPAGVEAADQSIRDLQATAPDGLVDRLDGSFRHLFPSAAARAARQGT